MRHFTSDHVGSDDITEVLEISRISAQDMHQVVAGPSRLEQPPSYLMRQEINGRLAAVEEEIKGVDADIEKLKTLRATLSAEKQGLLGRLNATRLESAKPSRNGKGRAEAGAVNYTHGDFQWSGELKTRMKSVFGINNFRLCQEGVCNANMDGRDIVCVMPTGGGKSLTYQLPALLNPGCTLVVSPLISLITDQILHLREAGVEAVMLTGSTSKEESRDIFSRLTHSAGVKGRNSYAPADGFVMKEIKLCYVTPEKIAKSKMFTSMLEKLASAGKLARIVIDEAHCVSQLGHDFRPDYKKLSILRQLFPRVPILALSATCPPKVLKDLVLTLRLRPVVDGKAANSDGTIYFSAPLYRKNLHYTVLRKPASASTAIQVMTDYILKEHRNDSGIVYCLSKKDAETVAAGIMEASRGKIRTGVYHADVGDKVKEGLHKRWRQGEVKVVCATIAFGLGIDKGDVRFVLHHSMSKSLDGYYQESGRAGRDGNDSDCILYYRPQDATRLSSLVCGELEVNDMLRFAQNLDECRKLQFAKYFSASSSLSISSWSTEEADALERCGHCDNCRRAPETIERKDVTVEAWKILRVAEAIERDGGRVTLGMLGDLVRGVGGGAYGVTTGGGRRGRQTKEKTSLDLNGIAGEKVSLDKDKVETLLVYLLLSQYLKESFHSTAYTINVYVLPGVNSLRLTRRTREEVANGTGQRVELSFAKKTSKKSGSKSSREVLGSPSENQSTISHRNPIKNSLGKRRRVEHSSDEDLGDDDECPAPDNDLEDFSERLASQDPTEDEEDEWAFTMSRAARPKNKLKGNNEKRRRLEKARTSAATGDNGVIILSSE